MIPKCPKCEEELEHFKTDLKAEYYNCTCGVMVFMPVTKD